MWDILRWAFGDRTWNSTFEGVVVFGAIAGRVCTNPSEVLRTAALAFLPSGRIFSCFGIAVVPAAEGAWAERVDEALSFTREDRFDSC